MLHSKKWKKSIVLLVILVLLIQSTSIFLPSAKVKAYDPGDFDFTNTITGPRIISSGGIYLVKGTYDASGSGENDGIRINTADPVTLILDGATFSTTGSDVYGPLVIGTTSGGGANATMSPDIQADVTIILAAGSENEFRCTSISTSSSGRTAGICVNIGSKLTIKSEEGEPGKLTALGGAFSAGIGAGPNQKAGTIIIESGIIRAESYSADATPGRKNGAGIGGGGGNSGGGGGAEQIIIRGTANVMAISHGQGAGIGGAGGGSGSYNGHNKAGDGSTVLISDNATVHAESKGNGAGIGGGSGSNATTPAGNGGTVTISDNAKVDALSAGTGAGIGGGGSDTGAAGAGAAVTISGTPIIDASSASGNRDIGPGTKSDLSLGTPGSLKITSGNVKTRGENFTDPAVNEKGQSLVMVEKNGTAGETFSDTINRYDMANEYTYNAIYNGSGKAYLWIPKFIVSYIKGDGVGDVPASDAEYKYIESVTVLGNVGSAPLEKASYTFAGWTDVDSGTEYDADDDFDMPARKVTLTPRWASTVDYDVNGGNAGSGPLQETKVPDGNHTLLISPKPTHVQDNGVDVVFIGWTEVKDTHIYTKDDTAPATITTVTVGGNTTVYAVWGLDTNGSNTADVLDTKYKVEYDENGGNSDVPTPVENILTGTVHTLSTTGPTHVQDNGVDVVFIGWTESPDTHIYTKDDTAPVTITTVTVGGNTTVYAVWGLDTNGSNTADVLDTKYKVEYDENGGNSDGPTAAMNILTGTVHTLSTTGPTHAQDNGVDVVFIGWTESPDNQIYTKDDTAPVTITNVTVTGNTRVYAVWGYDTNNDGIPDSLQNFYTVIYLSNRNTDGAPPVDRDSYVSGSSVTILGSGSLVRDGYTFAGWINPTNGMIYSENDVISMAAENLYLNAQWSETPYNVTYMSNDHTAGTVPLDGNNPYAIDNSVTVMGQGTLAREGYYFAGWVSSVDGNIYKEGETFMVDLAVINAGGVVLTAKWNQVTYNVTYVDTAGAIGSVPVDTANYISGGTVIVAGSGSLSRTGYNFVGWKNMANGNEYSEADVFVITENVTLTAQWVMVPLVTEPPVTEPPVTVPPVTEPPVTDGNTVPTEEGTTQKPSAVMPKTGEHLNVLYTAAGVCCALVAVAFIVFRKKEIGERANK